MKKIFNILCISLCLLSMCFGKEVKAVGDYTASIVGDVTCFTGEELLDIDEQIITISLEPSDQCSFTNLEIDDDITSWFVDVEDTFVSNRPLDLEAYVYGISEDGSSIEVLFCGEVFTTEEVGTRFINVNIPKENVLYGYYNITNNIVITNSDTAHYIVKSGEFWMEYKGPYEVKGTVGELLETDIVVVKILRNNKPSEEGDEIDVTILNTELANLPTINGLAPSIVAYDNTNLEITIKYEGKPLAPSQDMIHTIIPADCWTEGKYDKTVPDRVDVKFNIIPKQEEYNEPDPIIEDDEEVEYIKPVFILPKTGIR